LNNLIVYPSQYLDTLCETISKFTEDIRNELDNMKEIMLQHKGIGLAANQIGINKRMFIMLQQSDKSIVEFINPEITEQSPNFIMDKEGCLSFPNIALDIRRSEHVIIKAYNRKEEEFQVMLYGIEARCALHEVEHLDGKTFLQHVSRQQRRYVLRQLNKKR